MAALVKCFNLHMTANIIHSVLLDNVIYTQNTFKKKKKKRSQLHIVRPLQKKNWLKQQNKKQNKLKSINDWILPLSMHREGEINHNAKTQKGIRLYFSVHFKVLG